MAALPRDPKRKLSNDEEAGLLPDTPLVSAGLEPIAAPAAPVAEPDVDPSLPAVRFSDAFAEARAANQPSFEWEGKSYNTQLKEEAAKPAAKAPAAQKATPGLDVFGNPDESQAKPRDVPVMVRPGMEKAYVDQNRPAEKKRLQDVEKVLWEDKIKSGAASFDRKMEAQQAEIDARAPDRAVEYSVDQGQKLAGQAAQAFGGWLDNENISRWGDEYVAKQDADMYFGNYKLDPKSVIDTYKQGGFGAALQKVGDRIAENWAPSGAALIGGLSAAAVAPFSAPAAALLGGVTMAGAGVLGVGEVKSELVDKGIKGHDGLAIGAGALIGILDTFGAGKVIPTDMITKATGSEVITALLEKGHVAAAKALAWELSKKASFEVGTELTQEGIAMGAAASQGAKYSKKEVIHRLVDTAFVALGLGGGGAAVSTGAEIASGPLSKDALIGKVMQDNVDRAQVANPEIYPNGQPVKPAIAPHVGDTTDPTTGSRADDASLDAAMSAAIQQADADQAAGREVPSVRDIGNYQFKDHGAALEPTEPSFDGALQQADPAGRIEPVVSDNGSVIEQAPGNTAGVITEPSFTGDQLQEAPVSGRIEPTLTPMQQAEQRLAQAQGVEPTVTGTQPLVSDTSPQGRIDPTLTTNTPALSEPVQSGQAFTPREPTVNLNQVVTDPAAQTEPSFAEQTVVAPEEQAAVDLIAAIEDPAVTESPSTAQINSVAMGLGLEVGIEATPQETIERIRTVILDDRDTPDTPAAPIAPVMDGAVQPSVESVLFGEKPAQGAEDVRQDNPDQQVLDTVAAKYAAAAAQPGADVHVQETAARLASITVVDPATLPDDGSSGSLGKDDLAFLNQLGELTGSQFIPVNAPDMGAEQFVIPGVGRTVYVDVNAALSADPSATAGHETFHIAIHTLRNSPDAADQDIAAILDETLALNLAGKGLAKYRKYYSDPTLPDAKLREEAAADIAGNLHTDPAFWTRVVDAIEAKHGDVGVRKLVNAIKDAYTKLVNIAKGHRFQEGYVKNAEQVREAVAQALIQYYVNHGNAAAMALTKANLALPAVASSMRRMLPDPDARLTMSTTVPKSKNKGVVTDAGFTEEWVIDSNDIKASDKHSRAMVAAVRSYNAFQLKGRTGEVLDQLRKQVTENLLWLHDLVPESTRARAKLWYDGANRIANDWAAKTGMTPRQVAGVLAVLSPQMDWFKNVSLAERILTIWTQHRNEPWTPAMTEWVRSYVAASKDVKEMTDRTRLLKDAERMEGKPLAALGTDMDRAKFVRVFDETYFERAYRLVTPEGGFGEYATKAENAETGAIDDASVTWGSFREISKAVSILEDGSARNVHDKLGNEHKVRNFYNNIINPGSAAGHVTIDTHAIAAATLKSLSGADIEVLHNFGTTQPGIPGAGQNTETGASGTYGLFADAYRDAAEARGILPREMQSITWEAVRALFPAGIKSALKAPVSAVWDRFRAGELTRAQAQEAVLKLSKDSKGMAPFTWENTPAGNFAADGGTSFDTNLAANPENRKARTVAPADTKDKIEVSLSASTTKIPGLGALYAQAQAGDTAAHVLLQDVALMGLRHVLRGTSAKVKATRVTGVFGGETEPSYAATVTFTYTDRDAVLAGLKKFADNFMQDQVHVRQPTKDEAGTVYDDGSYSTPVYRWKLNKELTRKAIDQIIAESGLYGLNTGADFVESYYVGDPTNAEAVAEYERNVAKVTVALGRNASASTATHARLWAYGDRGEGAIGWPGVDSDLSAEPSFSPDITQRVASYLNGGRKVKAFDHKDIDEAQRTTQETIRAVFDMLPDNDLNRAIVKRAYNAAAKELKRQYEAMPVRVEIATGQGEPYANSDEMRSDLADNNHLYIYATTPETFGPAGVDFTGHPLLEQSGLTDVNDVPLLVNDVLRAVHDYFAHNLSATQFGPKGEEAGWRNHMSMTADPLARWAITAETRGQNSWVNFRPQFGGDRGTTPLIERDFARQKAALLPIEFTLTGDRTIDAPVKKLMESLGKGVENGSAPKDWKAKAEATLAEEKGVRRSPIRVTEPGKPGYTDPYDNFETRPDTTEVQRDLGRAALAAAEERIFGRYPVGAGAKPTLLGSGISADFRKDGGTSLVGQKVGSAEDLAILSQVLRDPRFETIRVFYTAGGEIVGETAYSSRLPGAAWLPNNVPDTIKSDMERFVADGYWLEHNHPSGSAIASSADLQMTKAIAAEVPGFQGHVIIDHNQFGHITVDPYGNAHAQVIDAPELAKINLRANHEVPHPFLGEAISSPQVFAGLAKRMQQKDGYVTLIGTDSLQRVTLITEVPAQTLQVAKASREAELRLLARVKRATRETGARNLFAVVPGSLADYRSLTGAGIFLDVVDSDGRSSAAMHGSGRLPETKVEKRGGKTKVAEDSPAEIRAKADQLKAMTEDQRDDLDIYDFGWRAYVLYEAEKMMPKKEGTMKGVNDNNSNTLWEEADAVANINGEPWLATKQEDPDDENDEGLTVWAFTSPRETLGEDYTTAWADKAEAIAEFKDHLASQIATDEVQEMLEPEIKFSLRRGPAPEKTVKAYKLFRMDKSRQGELFALFVNSKTPIPLNEWLDAAAVYSFIGVNGRRYVPATTGGSHLIPNDTVRKELFDLGFIKSMKTKSVKGVAYRPGWHAGDLPVASHIGSKSSNKVNKPDTRSDDHVWAEVEMPADFDWQPEATKRGSASGKFRASEAHITDQIPKDGFYRYKTNPNMTGNWLIGGAVKVLRILSDAEVGEINGAAGVADLPRATPLDLAAYGFKRSPSRKTPEELAAGHAVMMGQDSDAVVDRLEQAMAETEEDFNAAKRGVVSTEETDAGAEALAKRLHWSVEAMQDALARGNIEIGTPGAPQSVPAAELLGAAATTVRVAMAELLQNPEAPHFAKRMASVINLMVATRANLSEIGRALNYAGQLQRRNQPGMTEAERTAKLKKVTDELLADADGIVGVAPAKMTDEEKVVVAAWNEGHRIAGDARNDQAEAIELSEQAQAELDGVRQTVKDARQARDEANQQLRDANAELKKQEERRARAVDRTASAFDITRAEGEARRATNEAKAAKEWEKLTRERLKAAGDRVTRAKDQLQKARDNAVDPAEIKRMEQKARLAEAEATLARNALQDAEQKIRDAERRLKVAQEAEADARGSTPTPFEISQAQGAARRAEQALAKALAELRVGQKELSKARRRLKEMQDRADKAILRLQGIQRQVAQLKAPQFLGKGGVSMAEIEAYLGGPKGMARIQRAMRAQGANLNLDLVAQFFQGVAEAIYAQKLEASKRKKLNRMQHSFMASWLELFRAMNLTGMFTHFVNTLSNAYFAVQEMTVTQALAQGLDGGPKAVARHYSIAWQALMHSLADVKAAAVFGLTQEFPAAHFEALTKARPQTRQELLDLGGNKWMDNHGGALPGTLGRGVRTVGFSPLGAMDLLFKLAPYRYSIAMQQAKNPGKPVDFKKAVEFAEFGTFQTKLGKLTGQIPQVIADFPVLGFLLPYVKTLVNLIKVAATMDPLLSTAMHSNDMLGANGKDAQRLGFARVMVSFALAAAVLALYGEGDDDEDNLLQGAAPLDPKERALWETSHTSLGLKVGDGRLSLQRIEPLAGAATLIIADKKAAGELSEGEFVEAMKTLATAWGQLVIGKSFMKTPADALAAAMDVEGRGDKFAERQAASIIWATLIPNFFSQLGDMIDPVKRETVNPWTDTPLRRLPWTRESLDPQLDWAGREVANPRHHTLSPLAYEKEAPSSATRTAEWLLRNDVPLEAQPKGLKQDEENGRRLSLGARREILQHRAAGLAIMPDAVPGITAELQKMKMGKKAAQRLKDAAREATTPIKTDTAEEIDGRRWAEGVERIEDY